MGLVRPKWVTQLPHITVTDTNHRYKTMFPIKLFGVRRKISQSQGQNTKKCFMEAEAEHGI